jgi:hypothetical protein
VEGVFKPNTVESVDVAEEDRHGGTVRRDARTTHKKAVEHVQKAGDLPEGRAQVDVLAAGLRQQGAKLGKTQRTENRDDAGDDPRAQHEGGRADGLGHDGGLEENAGTDGDPDDQRCCMDQGQPTAGLERGGAHGMVFQRE